MLELQCSMLVFLLIVGAGPFLLVNSQQVDVSTLTDDGGNSADLSGQAITAEGLVFDYESNWKQNKQVVTFALANPIEDIDDEYISFELVAKQNEQKVNIKIGTKNGNVGKIKIKPDKDPNDQDRSLLESVTMSKLGQSFVSASMIMGGDGYYGSDNRAVLSFHRMALWMARVTNGHERRLKEGNFNSSIVADEEIAVPVEVDGNQELYDFEEQEHHIAERNLACPKKSCCGNGCFGMCGLDCNCWSWICGGCGCVNDCMEHDYYCSCISIFHFWCVNVFWVGCSNGGWVDYCPWWG